jgi:hypothetical protein
MRLHHPTQIESSELRDWAYESDPSPPVNADPNVWDLMVTEWFADDRLYVALASDAECPKRLVFEVVLRERLRRRCARTRWLSLTTEQLLSGVPPSSWNGRAAGLGRKGKSRARDAFARRVGEANEADARQYAEALLALVHVHPELQELAARLERFLREPATVADPYWQAAWSHAGRSLG